jgi:hypothetical protein
VSVAFDRTGGAERPAASTSTAHIVLDAEDRLVAVGPEVHALMGPFVGHVLWERLPGAEPLLGPHFDRARELGEPVEFTVYYAGRVRSYRAVPAGDRLVVDVEHSTKLDVTSLDTLARSLSQIEAELAARARGRLDPRAPSSLRALP